VGFSCGLASLVCPCLFGLLELEGFEMENIHKDNWVTTSQLEDWIGSDHMNTDELLNLLHDLINNNYSIDEFKKDVLSY
jgi:hypothetical protein